MNPKYPHIEVELTGQNGNAFMVMGLTKKALQDSRVPKEEIDEYLKQAMSGDYNHLLQVTMQTVTVI